MSPRSSIDGISCGGIAYAKLDRQRFSSFSVPVSPYYFSYYIFIEFSPRVRTASRYHFRVKFGMMFRSARHQIRHPSGPMLLALLGIIASLIFTIQNIVYSGSEEQMKRIGAHRIVTFMEYKNTIGYLSELNCPRNAMGPSWKAPYGHGPIPVFIECSDPKPALSKRLSYYWTIFIDSPPVIGLVFFRQFTDWTWSILHNLSMWIVSASRSFQAALAHVLFTPHRLSFN